MLILALTLSRAHHIESYRIPYLVIMYLVIKFSHDQRSKRMTICAC